MDGRWFSTMLSLTQGRAVSRNCTVRLHVLLLALAFLAVLFSASAQAQIAFRGAASAGVASGAGGAVTYQGATTSSGNGNNLTLTIPGSAQANDLLLAVIAVEDENTGSITPPFGFTLIRGENAGNHVQLTYYRFATAADVAGSASWSWSWGGNEDYSGGLLAFRGVDASNPIDVHAGLATNSSNQTTVDIPAVTPSIANTLLVAAVSIRSGSTFSGWSGSLTERTDDRSGGGGNEVAHGTATRAGPAAGVSSGTFTVTASDNDTSRVGQLIALRPSVLGLTINRPPGTTTGDVMIAAIAVRPSSTLITPPPGWSAQAATVQNAGNSSRQQIFYKVVTNIGAEPANYTWLFDTVHTGAAGGIVSYSGVDTAAPINAFGGNTTPQGGDSNVQHRALAVNTTVADAMVISTHSYTSAETWNPPPGMTERVDVASEATPSAAGIAVEMNEVTQAVAGSTGDKLATAAGSGDTGTAHLIALRPFVPQPVLHFAMDALSWNGTPGEVLDSSGNGLHGRAFNGANTAFVTPAIAGSPGTCRYGTFDGTTQYVETANNALLNVTDELTVLAWIRPTALPTGGNLKTIISKDNNYEFHLDSAGRIFWWWGGGALQLRSNGAVAINTWTHVAIVYSRAGAFQRIYLNGVQDSATNNQAGALAINAVPFQVGSDQGFAGRQFAGLIDEVYVFRSALSQTRIQQYLNTTRACASAINHFSISHAGSGVGCVDQPITITAHDATHSPVDANALMVNLSTTNTQGTWTGIQSGGGVLNDPVAGDGAATYTFVAGSTTATLLFRYSSLGAPTETFGFNVSGGGYSETTGTANAGDDPSFTMALAGFRFRNIEDANETIPLQISGKPSNTGFNARTIRLQAINTNTASGSCTNIFASQTRTVDLGGECNSPATCAGRQVSINGAGIATSNNNGGAGAAAYTGVSLNFNGNSEADTVIVYPDAGQISLHAQFDLNPLVAGFEMVGSSNNFIERPFGLAFPGVNHSNTAAGTLIGAAGDNFSMTVTGYQWASGEDTNDDGVPDAGVNITDNGTVPNFAATVTVAVSANLPGAAAGAISRGVNCLGAATAVLAGGTVTPTDWCYSEAGNVLLNASVTNYLSAGVSITGNSGLDGTGAAAGHVGRFRPKNFVMTLPSLANRTLAACLPSSAFTYMDEGLTLAFTLTARNTQGAQTFNYTGAYAKHDPTAGGSNNTKTAYDVGARNVAPFAALTGRVSGTYVTSPPVWANGVLNVSGSNATLVNVGRIAAPDGPYTQVQFGIAPTDSDGVLMASYDLDVDNSAGNDHTLVGPTTEVRFGRLRLGSASGSPLLPLRMPVEAQYWNGTFFVTNVADSCTMLATANVGLGNYLGNLNAGETTVSPVTNPLSAGRGAITLSAPGGGNNGSVDVAINLGTGANADACPAFAPAATAGNKSYLRGSWCTPPGTYTKDPSARARFGIRGGDERIYLRENY